MAADDPEGDDTRTIWPFFAAAGVAVVILAAVLLSNLGSSGPSDQSRVVRAVQEFVGAHNSGDPARRTRAQCSGFEPARSPLAGQTGRVGLVKTAEPRIQDDRATVAVTTKPDGGSENTAVWSVVRTPDGWRVCD